MGLLDRLRDRRPTGESSHEKPVHDYRNALLSSPTPVIGAGHTQAFEALNETVRSELRRRLDAHLSSPVGLGDSSPPALAADVTQLRATGAHAVLDLLSAEPTGVSAVPLPVEQIARDFLHSHAFQVFSGELGRRDSVPHERADAEAYAQSFLAYMHNLNSGSGPNG